MEENIISRQVGNSIFATNSSKNFSQPQVDYGTPRDLDILKKYSYSVKIGNQELIEFQKIKTLKSINYDNFIKTEKQLVQSGKKSSVDLERASKMLDSSRESQPLDLRKLKDSSIIFKHSNPLKFKPIKTTRDLENIEESDEELHDSIFSIDQPEKDENQPEPKAVWKLNILKFQHFKYRIAKIQLDKTKSNNFCLYRAKHKFKNSLINCVKYNYSLEESVQNFSCFDAFIQLSKDFSEFIITIKKPIENPEYVLQADPKEVEKIVKQKKKQLEKKKDPKLRKKSDLLKEQGHLLSLDQEYQLKKSSCSFQLKDITGFIFGGQSSRFWMLRKHMISLDVSQYNSNKVPFYSWQCITIQLTNREVDLVIPDQSNMDDFIMILVDYLKTTDGVKNSQLKVEQQILKRKQILKQQGSKIKINITESDKNNIFQTTLMKLKIMRIRQKIGYMAFLKNTTINEMILETINNSYDLFIEKGYIKRDPVENLLFEDKVYYSLINDNFRSIFKKIVILNRMKKKLQEYADSIEISDEKRQQKIAQKYKELNIRGSMGLKQPSDVVDSNKEQMRLDKIQAIYNMQYGFDEYQLQDWGYKGKSLKNFGRLVSYKQLRKFKMMHHSQMKLLINFGVVKGINYIRATLLRFKLAKEVFIADIEQGREVYIPEEICIDRYPVSFRYYDCILRLVHFNISDDMKQYYSFKNSFRMEFYENEDFKQMLLEKLGIQEKTHFDNESAKLTFRHSIVNRKEQNSINHCNSHHVLGLQKSKYLVIDDNISNIQRNHRIKTKQLKQNQAKQQIIGGSSSGAGKQKVLGEESSNVFLRFCPSAEITNKRQTNIVVQQKFLGKHRFMQMKGQSYDMMMKLEEYIEKIIEEQKIPEVKYIFYVRKKEALLQHAENLLISRVRKARQKSLKTIRDNTKVSQDFHFKQIFLQQNIIKCMRYFKSIKEVMKAEQELKDEIRRKQIAQQKLLQSQKFTPIKQITPKKFINHYNEAERIQFEKQIQEVAQMMIQKEQELNMEKQRYKELIEKNQF